MNDRSRYNTRQREALRNYLESMSGAHITVSDACDHFRAIGSPIGQATVYRQFERMVAEGAMKKYIIEGAPACFEYTPEPETAVVDQCFHLKCEICGRLIHMRCGELESIAAHLEAEHNFALDSRRTVFYGVCEQCSQS